MSGGHLNYFYSYMEEHVGDFGDKELDELVKDLAELFHDREWFLSGDTGAGNWNEARDAFKDKWFTQHGRQERIEKYLAELGNEVRKSFGIGGDYCKDCAHWAEDKKYDGRYGKCDFQKSCVMHRSESCDKFVRRDADADCRQDSASGSA